jgi:hypothetical protein
MCTRSLLMLRQVCVLAEAVKLRGQGQLQGRREPVAYLQNFPGCSMAAPGRPGPAVLARQACSSYSPFLCLK